MVEIHATFQVTDQPFSEERWQRRAPNGCGKTAEVNTLFECDGTQYLHLQYAIAAESAFQQGLLCWRYGAHLTVRRQSTPFLQRLEWIRRDRGCIGARQLGHA